MRIPIKLSAWIILILAAMCVLLTAALRVGQPRHWQPNPEIGHRAAHKSGNMPP